ncbi:MAG: hypothetical protein OEU26_15515 [Candidatus Tectomicrobia bacterium]|nr:hypothetical protein [Candidatus Tectomicrobia bacterium]
MTPNQFSLCLIVGIGALALAWMIFAKVFVSPNLASAYRGEGPPLLNRAIRELTQFRTGEQALSRSVKQYTRKWDEITWRILSIILLVGAIMGAISRPEVQRRIDAWQGRWATAPLAVASLRAIGRPRRWLVHAAIIVIVCGSLLPITTGIEYWPFSHYRMYAGVQGPTITKYFLFGIMAHGEEIALSQKHIRPFHDTRLGIVLRKFRSRAPGEEKFEKALGDVLGRYETMRVAGAHDGPPLRGMKLYGITWKLSPAHDTDFPQTKELIFRYERMSRAQ